jgi:GT2 family glycosyltransferase
MVENSKFDNSISYSIVLYKSDKELLNRIVSLLLLNKTGAFLYLIDNSPSDELRIFDKNSRVEYIHNPSNPGFGVAHNIAINKAIEKGLKYHFIINPDIYFEGDVISQMIKFIEKDNSIGMLMPQILNLDGSVQHLPKLLPNPLSILLRKFKKPNAIFQKFINQYELRFVPQNVIYNAPILSGCFTLLNLKAIQEIGMYDDNYFMYFEDWDLSRRMHKKYKTIYYPLVSVYHGYESGANKSFKLFKIFIHSAITYFNKWGWFFDEERKHMNKKALSQF